MGDLPEPLDTFLRSWKRHDVEAVVQLYDEDAEMRDPTLAEPIRGTDALRAYYRTMWAAWPEARLTCRCAEADARGIAWTWRFSGAGLGVVGCSYFGLEGGRITTDHAVWDPVGIQ